MQQAVNKLNIKLINKEMALSTEHARYSIIVNKISCNLHVPINLHTVVDVTLKLLFYNMYFIQFTQTVQGCPSDQMEIKLM